MFNSKNSTYAKFTTFEKFLDFKNDAFMKIATLIFFFTVLLTYSQQSMSLKSSEINPKNGYSRCSTKEYEDYLLKKNPKRLSAVQFENWIAPIIATEKQKNKNNKTKQTQVVYNIPVVIHVIHNGAPINTIASHTSENISYAQALSQVTVMNQDFRRMAGTPGNGSTGYNLGVDCEINFVLAKQDPNGLLTNGVDRVNMGQTAWSIENVDDIVKPQTQWDPTKYLNMWVVNLVDKTILGYAQFPSGSTLPGIGSNGGQAKTDGVVASYDAFGTITVNDGSFTLNSNYNLGRTMTHEVGHWLGLRHIWGDDDECTPANSTTGDYVADTPDSNIANYDCVTISHCTGNDMIENYMDYTNDACMNTFTAGQKARMIAVMTNSERRKELSSSNGSTPGVVYALDAKITNVAISVDGCNKTFLPFITIENRGTTTLTTVSINYKLDNESAKTYLWTGNLSQYATTDIHLSSIVSTDGPHNFTASINTINSLNDLNTTNNTFSKEFIQALKYDVATTTVSLALQCDRDGSETTYELKDSRGNIIYNGGPFTDITSSTSLNPVINDTFKLIDGECYTFTIYDSYGDGIATNGGKGSYTLKDENNIIITSGGVFTDTESTSLVITTIALQNFEDTKGINAYPNPATEVLNLKVSKSFGLPNSVTIIDILGKIVSTKIISTPADLSINTSFLTNGIYFITIQKENEKKTLRFIKK